MQIKQSSASTVAGLIKKKFVCFIKLSYLFTGSKILLNLAVYNFAPMIIII